MKKSPETNNLLEGPSRLTLLKSEISLLLKKGAPYLAAILSVVALLLVIDLHSSERIYPRVMLGPIAVGYSHTEEAQQKIETVVQNYLVQPITFSLVTAAGQASQQIQITPAELGMSFQSQAAIASLPRFDFNKSPTSVLLAHLINEERFPLHFSADGNRALEILEQKLNLKQLRAQNARFIFDKNTLHVQPEINGSILDRPGLLALLDAESSELKNSPVSLNLIPELAQVKASDLAGQQDLFQTIIKQPLQLWHEGRKWKLDPALHVEALHPHQKTLVEFKKLGIAIPVILKKNISGENEEYRIHQITELAFDESQLGPFLQKEIIGNINKPTSDVKIFKDGGGKIVIDGKGENGLNVPESRLVASLNMAINSHSKQVQVPVAETKAAVTISPDLQSLGIKNLIATGHTSYYGSPPNRMHNINVGIQKYNGLIIKPGEKFSFNQYLGEVDGGHGFLMEKIIKQNKIELEMGGGLCQVSTTAYRAALLAGVKILARAPHSWKVSYYSQVLGHGLDATIYPGVQDFQFLNDTPANLLIQAYADGANAYFKFYGTDDGRKAILDGPHGGGLNYTWYRTIIKDGEAKKETIVSTYKPIPPPDPPPAPPGASAPAKTADQKAANHTATTGKPSSA